MMETGERERERERKRKKRNADYTKQITLLTTNEQNETQLRCAFFIQLLRLATIELIERKLLKYYVLQNGKENVCVFCEMITKNVAGNFLFSFIYFSTEFGEACG